MLSRPAPTPTPHAQDWRLLLSRLTFSIRGCFTLGCTPPRRHPASNDESLQWNKGLTSCLKVRQLCGPSQLSAGIGRASLATLSQFNFILFLILLPYHLYSLVWMHSPVSPISAQTHRNIEKHWSQKPFPENLSMMEKWRIFDIPAHLKSLCFLYCHLHKNSPVGIPADWGLINNRKIYIFRSFLNALQLPKFQVVIVSTEWSPFQNSYVEASPTLWGYLDMGPLGENWVWKRSWRRGPHVGISALVSRNTRILLPFPLCPSISLFLFRMEVLKVRV